MCQSAFNATCLFQAIVFIEIIRLCTWERTRGGSVNNCMGRSQAQLVCMQTANLRHLHLTDSQALRPCTIRWAHNIATMDRVAGSIRKSSLAQRQAAALSHLVC
jgi:hypothetical protein